MKHKIIFKAIALLAIACALYAFSILQEVDNYSFNSQAELLDRSPEIQLGIEWDQVQNDYGSLVQKLNADHDDAMSAVRLAHLFIKEARVTGEHGHYYPAALDLLNGNLEKDKITKDEQFLTLMTKAGVQLSLHDFSDALETGTAAALINPANAQIHGVLVDANVELGNYEKAIALVDRMVQLRPDLRSYSRVSYLRQINGDLDGAIDAMIMAVKAGVPGSEETAWAMLTLGEIYLDMGRVEEAQSTFEAILSQRPNYPFAVAALGDVAMANQDLVSAERYYQEAIDIIPEVGFYISLAHLYKGQGRLAEADALADEILVMLKDDTDSGHNMNLEYADVYLTLIEDPGKAQYYAQAEYQKRSANRDVKNMYNRTIN
jgi:tetratricopeptide (TPR) repeat protein